MPGAVAFQYLRAACEAFPFASEAAHKHRVFTLGRDQYLTLDATTDKLAREFETWMLPRARGHSIDTIRQIRDATWFRDNVSPCSISLAKYLISLAEKYLKRSGGHAALRTEPFIHEPLEHFRWLSLLLPSDLLVAALFATNPDLDPASDHIDLLTPHLSRRLEQDVAETHLHLNAAASFPLVWIGLMSAMGKTDHLKTFAALDDSPFGAGKAYLEALTAAASTRLLLAMFLRERRVSAFNGSFDDFIHDENGPFPDKVVAAIAWPAAPHTFAETCWKTLRAVAFGKSSLNSAEMAKFYQHLRQAPEWFTADEDPLAAWFSKAPGESSAETRFTCHALRYLRQKDHEKENQDDGFAIAFWQYQRIRTITFRYLVVEPGTGGLGWFRKHFGRLSALQKCVPGPRFETAIHCTRRGIGLSAIEMRTGPRDDSKGLLRLIRQASIPEFKELNRPEVGLILHFMKERNSRELKCLHSDPRQSAFSYRFGAYSAQLKNKTDAIQEVLHQCPETLVILRGIDVASDELAVPTWVYARHFTRIRQASNDAAATLARVRPKWKVTPMRATFHAGEEYRRLVEGLRRMHELLEFNILCAGDRIGHGLAAGTDPQRWAESNGLVLQPAEDRLDDLLWELDRYERGDFAVDAARSEYVRATALQLAEKIYGSADGSTLANLLKARHKRHQKDFDEKPLQNLSSDATPVEKLLHLYLTDEGVFLRSQEQIEVQTTKSEVRMLEVAGRWLRAQIASREITIEANPTSNLLINDMMAIDHHPAFKFQPLPGTVSDEEPLQLSINTDDPIVFATSLGDEYAYLYAALLRHGVGAHNALAWISARKEDGFRSRFTLPASAREDVIKDVVTACKNPNRAT
jgi:adenosine deaminase